MKLEPNEAAVILNKGGYYYILVKGYWDEVTFDGPGSSGLILPHGPPKPVRIELSMHGAAVAITQSPFRDDAGFPEAKKVTNGSKFLVDDTRSDVV